MSHFDLSHLELATANAFVGAMHRHHKPCTGHRFSLGAEQAGALVGVAIVGRPIARKTNHLTTLEVNRLCTNGTKNACSFLYSAAARAGKALGYYEIITFILATEPGTSLLAAGWECVGTTPGLSWSVPSRARESGKGDALGPKTKWRKLLRAADAAPQESR